MSKLFNILPIASLHSRLSPDDLVISVVASVSSDQRHLRAGVGQVQFVNVERRRCVGRRVELKLNVQSLTPTY